MSQTTGPKVKQTEVLVPLALRSKGLGHPFGAFGELGRWFHSDVRISFGSLRRVYRSLVHNWKPTDLSDVVVLRLEKDINIGTTIVNPPPHFFLRGGRFAIVNSRAQLSPQIKKTNQNHSTTIKRIIILPLYLATCSSCVNVLQHPNLQYPFFHYACTRKS